MLEALLKRVDGLEAQLKDKKKETSPTEESSPTAVDESTSGVGDSATTLPL